MADEGSPSQSPPHGPGGEFFVVGIGASAGGITALRQFFSRVIPDARMTYVVILHLSPQHESNLPSLIQSTTEIPVTQVTETVNVEPNHIYVVPPSKYLVMMDGKIRLAEPERFRGAHTSIDLLFRTLADAYGKNAVAILLSGTGADGTLGLGRIKEVGGFVIAQDPDDAEYADMPRNAIDSSMVDLVLPAAEMPAKLRALRDGAQRFQLPDEQEETPARELDSGALGSVLTLLRLRTGNDFSRYKRQTMLRRITRRLQVHELGDISAYLAYLREHPEEIDVLFKDLLITVTNFFRDHDSFEHLEAEIIPKLFAGKSGDDQVRVWSAGCATGEEAYSFAMLLAEYATSFAEPPGIQVFATDIDDKAIAEARDCRFPPTIALDVSAERLRRFFLKEGDHYQIRKDLRETVLFAQHNVLSDPPFSKLDLVSCRNLLIYLNRDMQERILGIFHFALRPNGYLFLGSSETAEMTPALFAPVDKKRRIYVRRAAVGPVQLTTDLLMHRRQARSPDQFAVEGRALSAGQLHQEVVEQLAPPSVLINEDYDTLHVSAHAGRYLRMTGGEPTRNLLKLVHPDLSLDLRTALAEAKNQAEGSLPESRRVGVDLEGEQRWVSLTVRSVTRGPEAARGFFLVIFDESIQIPAVVPVAAAEGKDRLEAVRQLEEELQRTRDQLRFTIEQYETSTEELRASNEELQAINEELRSATEELETSKEELQSVNEELTTVNQEYKEKIEEIGRANSDLQNLMASTDIGTIFLDRGLLIKRYTPRAQQLFNITATDIGRPLEHFTNKLEYTALTKDAEEVLRSLQPTECEVRGADGSWYLARLTPYRTVEDKIEGVVLTFVDITSRLQGEEKLRLQAAALTQQTEILKLAHVLIRDDDDLVVSWNAGCERLYGYSTEEAVGRNAHELLKTEFSQPLAEIEEQLRQAGQWEGELVHTTRSGGRVTVASHWVLHRAAPNGSPVVLEVNNDMTARRRAEEQLREADRNKDQFLAMLAHELRNPLGAMMTSVEILNRSENEPAPAVGRARGVIGRQLQHLVRLVDDLLDVERLTHGKIALKREHVLLSEIVDSAIEVCQPLIDSKTQEFMTSIPNEPVFLDGDGMRLAQVLSNLIQNAFKYTPVGGQIHLIAECSNSKVVIRVRDTGIGINPETVSRLFDVYSQGAPVAGTELKGLGLGLALVRRLVEMHGGTVEVLSEGTGKGSEFIVRLPMAAVQAKAASGAQKKTATASKASKRKVIVVDDNRDGADSLSFVLGAEGHDVRVFYDGPSAIKAAGEFQPDIAIVDIGLPIMNGHQVAARLREMLPKMTLIALSGWRIDADGNGARDGGFDHYFRKPIEAKELTKVFEKM